LQVHGPGRETVTAACKDISPMGVCFSAPLDCKKDDVLTIDYFLRDEQESVRLTVRVMWSEFVDPATGYFCGGEVLDVEEAKRELFAGYYFQRLRRKIP